MQVELLKDREYLGTVADIQLNGDYCAVRFDGKVQLHVLEGEGAEAASEERESKLFPEPGRNDVISCHALTPDFLVLGTDMGGLTYFFLEDWTNVQEFRHMSGIRQVFPEPNGTKCVIIDVKGQGYVYNPVTDEMTWIKWVVLETSTNISVINLLLMTRNLINVTLIIFTMIITIDWEGHTYDY